jgi:smad nuclear-interacting protein 1
MTDSRADLRDEFSRRHSGSRSASADGDSRRERRRRDDRERDIQGRGREEPRRDRRDDHASGLNDGRETSKDLQGKRRSRSPSSPRDDERRRQCRDRHSERDSRCERSPKRPNRDHGRDSRPFRDEDTVVAAPRRSAGPLPSQEASFSMVKDPSSTALIAHDGKPLPEKQKPNFEPTGLLAAATKTIEKADGSKIVLKYHEPPEARKPPSKDQWRLFIFKGPDIVDTIELGMRSCWLIGRELTVVDLPAEHPSISKQHAVIQFRYTEKRNEFGDKIGRVKPYLIDLESANGTKLNGEVLPPSRYLELRDKDLVQFGDSTREYVVMLPPKD